MGDVEEFNYLRHWISSRASLTVRFLRYEVEKGLRAVYGERGKDGKHGDVLRFSTEVFSGSPT